MAFQPGLAGSQFPGEDYILRELKDLRRAVQELSAADPFAPMGIKPVAGGINITGDLSVSGTISSLPSGSISNNALASPIQTATSSNYINNYAISTTSTARASLTLTVPSGFTQAIVISNPTAMGLNNTAAADYLYVQAVVNGVNGGELYTNAGPGLAVGLASPFHTTLTGLTAGQAITVAVATRAGNAAWAASTSNQANIYATAIFLR